MRYYNENTYSQWGRSEGYTTKTPEYVERKRFNALEERVDGNTSAIERIRQDVDDAVNEIRYHYAEINDLDWRLKKIEKAPSIAKKKRRVTVCAGGQKVEIVRVDS